MRFVDWSNARPPELDDIAFQISAAQADDAAYVRRAYRVAGIIEGRDHAHFKLVMERLDYDEAWRILYAGDARAPWLFEFFNVPRGQ